MSADSKTPATFGEPVRRLQKEFWRDPWKREARATTPAQPYRYSLNTLTHTWDILYHHDPREQPVYFAGQIGREADAKKMVALLNSCGYVPEFVRGPAQ